MINLKIGDLELEKIILGTSNFNAGMNESDIFDILYTYLENGGNAIDMARVYGALNGGEMGYAERLIKKFMELYGCRNQVKLITKGGFPHMDDYTSSRLSPKELAADLDASLDALGTNRIDIYFLHRDDERIDVSELIDVMDDFVKDGKIGHIGCSNWNVGRIAAANEYAKKNNRRQFEVSQIQWSLAATTPVRCADNTLVCMNKTEYDYYERTQMPIMAFASQAKGYFSKGCALGADGITGKAKDRFDTEENRERLIRVRKLCEKIGITPAQCALAYLLNSSLNAGAIVGCSNRNQALENIGARNILLDSDVVNRLFTGK